MRIIMCALYFLIKIVKKKYFFSTLNNVFWESNYKQDKTSGKNIDPNDKKRILI